MKDDKKQKEEKEETKTQNENELLGNIIYEESELKKWIEWRKGINSSSILSGISPLSMSDGEFESIRYKRRRKRKGGYLFKIIKKIKESEK